MKRDINKYVDNYSSSEFEAIMVSYRRGKVLETINRFPHKRILEIGCGKVPLFTDIQNFDKYVIVEPAVFFCEEAKQYAQNDNRIQIINGLFEDYINELSSINYDFILLSALLHEVSKPLDLLNAVVKCCNKNTIVHINVPNNRSFHMILAYESKIIKELGSLSERANLLQQHTSFDIDKLKTLVSSVGFNIKEEGSYFIKPFNHEKMEKMLEYNIINEDILNGFDRMIKYMPDLGAEIFVNVQKDTK